MISRKDVLKKAIEDCVTTMYKSAQPPCDIRELIKKSKETGEAVDSDEDPLYNKHYLPQNVFTEIEDMYMDAYGIRSTWHDYVDTVKEYLEKGGPHYEYHENHKKELVTTEPLEKLIGKEHADIVFELIDKCKHFYRYNADECAFRMNVCLGSSPTSNKEVVEQHYKEKGEDVKIDDSVYDTDEFWDKL